MNIVIIGDLFTFPEGSAATNRVYTYARGFQEEGHRVQVIGFLNNYMEQSDGVSEGIPYYNPFGQKERSGSFFVRRIVKLRKYTRTFSLLRKIHKEEKIAAINRWSDLFATQLFCWLMARYFGAKLIAEVNEHPLRYHREGFFRKKAGVLKFYADAWLSDGILCISRYLVEFHKQRGIREKKLFHVPSTVDPTRFAEKSARPLDTFYAGYFGSLTLFRDNIGVLLRAFALFAGKYPEPLLVMGGFCDPQEMERIRQLIRELGMEERVNILPYLPRTEIARYVQNADILVMSRAKDMASDASYPSKLTEFLATGQPVLSARVGEVGDFLQDGQNAYLFAPDDEAELASRLAIIYTHYQEALEVGRKGRELTTNGVFHYRVQAKRIAGYIETLRS